MADNINIQQLKEFFDFRANEQDRRIGKVETTVETISSTVSGVAIKVNTLWKAVGAIGLLILGVVVKLYVGI
jgi:hypothetical protein